MAKSKCQIAESIKVLGKLYNDMSDNASGKAIMRDLYASLNEKRASVQQAAAFVGMEPSVKSITAEGNKPINGGELSKRNGSVDKNQSIPVDSRQTGLQYALTNPTHISPKGYKWEKGDRATRNYLYGGIEYQGKKYADVEEAYQANKVKENAPKESSHNYKLMVELITIKLKKYDRLIKGINNAGGLEYLNRIVHQPTNNSSVWTTNGEDWFKSALIDAYKNVQASEGNPQMITEDTYAGIESFGWDTNPLVKEKVIVRGGFTGKLQTFEALGADGVKEVSGRAVKIGNVNTEFYLTKAYGGWKLYELTTGQHLASGDVQQLAINRAIKILNDAGSDSFYKVLNEAVNKINQKYGRLLNKVSAGTSKEAIKEKDQTKVGTQHTGELLSIIDKVTNCEG